MLKAWRAWKALTDEQRQIVQDKKVKLNRPVDEMIALLKPIADMDKTLNTSGVGMGCLMVIAAIALAIGGFIASDAWNLPGWLTGVWLLGSLALFIAPLVMWARTRKLDVSDNLRQSVVPMLLVFRDDIDASAPLELELDLRQPMVKEKLLREVKPRQRLTETFYSDPWMAADATLVDGSRLRWSVVDTIRHRSVTKKGSSGKWKTKTKDAKKCTVDVELTVRNKAYAVSGAEAGEKKSTLSAKKRLKLQSATPVDPKEIIHVITDLFRRVEPAK